MTCGVYIMKEKMGGTELHNSYQVGFWLFGLVITRYKSSKKTFSIFDEMHLNDNISSHISTIMLI